MSDLERRAFELLLKGNRLRTKSRRRKKQSRHATLESEVAGVTGFANYAKDQRKDKWVKHQAKLGANAIISSLNAGDYAMGAI